MKVDRDALHTLMQEGEKDHEILASFLEPAERLRYDALSPAEKKAY